MTRVNKKKKDTSMVAYRFPFKVIEAISARALETRRSKTTVVLMALEKDGIPAVK